MKRALYCSIIVDGTPDTSPTEHITFILRYPHLNEQNLWEVCERFLTMEDSEKKKGCEIAELICKVLEEHDIQLKYCRGQGYDNGSNMSGCYKGAQALIQEKNPQAVFSPCSAHTLNLCGIHAAESNVSIIGYSKSEHTFYYSHIHLHTTPPALRAHTFLLQNFKNHILEIIKLIFSNPLLPEKLQQSHIQRISIINTFLLMSFNALVAKLIIITRGLIYTKRFVMEMELIMVGYAVCVKRILLMQTYSADTD